jgi:type IV secretory pathway VirB4 component
VNFPLFNIKGHELTSLTGLKSFQYKLDLPDLEQMNAVELDSYIENFTKELCLLPEENFYKFYSLNNKSFINTSLKEIKLTSAKMTEVTNPLDIFFKDGINSSLDIFEDYLLLNSKFLRIISLKSMPSSLFEGELQHLSDYVLTFNKKNSSKSKRSLNTKRKLHYGLTLTDIKNIDSVNAYSEVESLLEQITNQEIALFNTEVYFLINAATKSELDKKSHILLEDLKLREAIPKIESIALKDIFLSLIPGVPPLSLRRHLIPGDFLTNMLPLFNDKLQVSGISLHSRRGNEINLNIFDKYAHNYNVLISGASGQGKSVIAQKILVEETKKGTKACVLDLGHSFEKTIKYLKGRSLSKAINPLSFKDPNYLKEFIISFTDQVWTTKEQGKLYKLIKTHINTATSFKELITLLEVDYHDLSYNFEGLWQFFDQEETDFKDLIYLDLSLYPERLKRPLIIYFIEVFKSLRGQKIFIFDECWGLLENNASYIAECFRTFRKENAAAIAISQNLDDFCETSLGRVIIQNSYLKLYFKQDIRNNTYLGEFEEDLIHDLRSIKGEYSEFLVSAENIKKITRFYPSHLEYELFTSDSKDLIQFKNYMDEKGKFIDFDKAITNYTYIKNVGAL